MLSFMLEKETIRMSLLCILRFFLVFWSTKKKSDNNWNDAKQMLCTIYAMFTLLQPDDSKLPCLLHPENLFIL